MGPCRVVFLSVVLFATGCSGLASSLILYPPPGLLSELDSAESLQGRTPPVKDAKLELFYEEFGPTGQEPDVFVLALTGNAGRAEYSCSGAGEHFRSWMVNDRLRVGVLALQYPGYGRSEGKATLASLGAASLDAFDSLQRRAQGRPVLVYGLSLGAAMALHVGAERPEVSGLILEKPAHLRKLILGRYGWWNLWLLALPVALGVPDAARSDVSASRIEAIPAVFLVTTRDSVMPEKYQRQVAEAYGGPNQVVTALATHNQPLGPHNAPGFSPAMEWLRVRTVAQD